MSRITYNKLNELMVEISVLSGIANSKQSAIDQGQKQFIYLEYATIYGGYRLVSVSTEHGGHFGAFGRSATEARLSAKEMYQYLTGIIVGLKNVKP